MRLNGFVALVVSLFLLLAGLRPDALPYFSRETRYSDAVISHWPNALYLREAILERGEFPVWRSTIMAGQPFAANPLNKTAYPLQWLVLLLPPALHLNLMIGLHLFIGGAGMAGWAKALGLRDAAAALSALAYTLSPPIIAHLGAGHLDIVYALAWWPWLMLSVKRLGVGREPASILLLALSAALVFLADVRVSLFAFVTAGGYAVLELHRGSRWRHSLRLVMAGGLFLLLTASVIVPLLAWSPYVSRASMTPTDAGTLSLQVGHLFGLMLFSVPPGVETLTYLGVPVAALAVVGLLALARRSGMIGWVALAAIVLYAMGPNGPLWPPLVRLIPALLWFRVPSRAWLILALLAPPLAGFGLQRLMMFVISIRSGQPVAGLHLVRLFVVAFAAAMVVIGVFALLSPIVPYATGIGAVFITASFSLFLVLALFGQLAPRRTAPILLALTFLDLTWAGVHWVRWRGQEAWLNPQRALAERLIADEASRVYSPTYSLEQQTAAAYGLRLFGGVDPFQVKGVVQAVAQGSGVPNEGYSVILPPAAGVQGDDLSQANRDAAINTPVLAEWDVSHVVAAYTISHPRLQYVDVINGVYIYRNRDYVARPTAARVPDWPSGWADLPDANAVLGLNRLTLTSALVSGAAFIVCVCAVTFIHKVPARLRPDTKSIRLPSSGGKQA